MGMSEFVVVGMVVQEIRYIDVIIDVIWEDGCPTTTLESIITAMVPWKSGIEMVGGGGGHLFRKRTFNTNLFNSN